MMIVGPDAGGRRGPPPPTAKGKVGVSRFDRTARKTARARQLRRDVTEVEKRLWSKLRGAQIDGASFRRQHPVGDYILDFYCPALRLAVELDGGQHAVAAARDRRRDEWLVQHGVTVLRFWNSDVTQNLSGVLEVIALKVADLNAHPPAAAARWRTQSSGKRD